MCHLIEFCSGFTTDLEVSPKQPLERVRIMAGTRIHAYLQPHVAESAEGPLEVADLYFEGGTVARGIRFERFRFIDE